jgi:hypothetical protein
LSDENDSDVFDLTPITHDQVQNDPKTPMYRAEYRRKGILEDSPFSPISSPTTKQDHQNSAFLEGTPTSDIKSNLHKRSLANRFLSYGSSGSATETSTPVSKGTVSKIPNSILKKNKITYDKDTSQKLVKLKPELSSALNENGELNPLKASKSVVISPKKEYISMRSHLSTKTKFSSPLTDSINGRNKRDFKSPYISSSPRKTIKNAEQDWIDDEEGGDDDDDDDDEEEEEPSNKRGSKSSRKPKKSKTYWFKKTVKALVDPQLPYILSLYLQLLFNVVIVSILLYFIYSFISTVRADVENKVDSYATDILQEISLCSREYVRNNCQPGQRVVALEAACSEWEKCMNRDPTTVGRAKIGAETFAEIINGFIKPISWKSMFFLLLITVGSLVLTNAAFGTYRNHAQYDPSSQIDNGPNNNNGGCGIPQTPMQNPYQTPHQLGYGNYTKYYTPRISPSSARHRSRSAKKIRN